MAWFKDPISFHTRLPTFYYFYFTIRFLLIIRNKRYSNTKSYLYPKSVDILYKVAKFAYYANTVIHLHNYSNLTSRLSLITNR